MNARLDHLVVVADTLEQGAQWCEATLGAAPVTGGRHPHMEAARSLYGALGFEEIPPYYFNPIPGAHYLKAQLE